jgi:hypothetical protein
MRKKTFKFCSIPAHPAYPIVSKTLPGTQKIHNRLDLPLSKNKHAPAKIEWSGACLLIQLIIALLIQLIIAICTPMAGAVLKRDLPPLFVQKVI